MLAVIDLVIKEMCEMIFGSLPGLLNLEDVADIFAIVHCEGEWSVDSSLCEDGRFATKSYPICFLLAPCSSKTGSWKCQV